MRLGLRVGQNCATLLDRHIRDVPAGVIQCDDQWGYVAKKDKMLTEAERMNPAIGSQFLFTAMDGDTMLFLSHRIGKRTPENTVALMRDLRARVVGRPTIITDGFPSYIPAVEDAFGQGCDFGMLVKSYREGQRPVREGYAPTTIVNCNPTIFQGKPEQITTSHMERFDCTTRQWVKRMARLTLALSKRMENLQAALALHIASYNFCKVYGSPRCTPAMESGIFDSIWSKIRCEAFHGNQI